MHVAVQPCALICISGVQIVFDFLFDSLCASFFFFCRRRVTIFGWVLASPAAASLPQAFGVLSPNPQRRQQYETHAEAQ